MTRKALEESEEEEFEKEGEEEEAEQEVVGMRKGSSSEIGMEPGGGIGDSIGAWGVHYWERQEGATSDPREKVVSSTNSEKGRRA